MVVVAAVIMFVFVSLVLEISMVLFSVVLLVVAVVFVVVLWWFGGLWCRLCCWL